MEDAKKRTQCVKDIFKKTLNYESEKSIGLFTFFDNNQNVKSAFVKKDKKALYDKMLPIYQSLNRHFDITHIYFFDKIHRNHTSALGRRGGKFWHLDTTSIGIGC